MEQKLHLNIIEDYYNIILIYLNSLINYIHDVILSNIIFEQYDIISNT